jgi:peptidoglycan biosynthesis protein MviN/MurJ (putative lipid II flippase)
LYAAERMIASNMETGTLAGLNYAYRVAQFPNWVFVAAVTAVILPAMSKAPGGSREAKTELYRALKGTLALTIPAAALLFLLRETLIGLLFGRGAFDSHSVEVTAGMLAGYAFSVVGQALSGICLRYFLTVGRLYKPAAVCLASACVTIVFDLAAVPSIGPSALGWGSLAGWGLNALLMFGLVVRDSSQRSG